MLRKRGEFEAVLRDGIKVVSNHFIMRASPNALARARLGMIAGRKAAPRAIDRNRGKRLIREAFRRCLSFGAYDVVVQLRDNLREEDNHAVRAELDSAFVRLAKRCSRSGQSVAADQCSAPGKAQ